MYGKALNSKEAIRILNDNGWELQRTKGDHLIFKKENASNNISITNGKAFSQKTWKRVCKTNGIRM